MDKQIVVIAKSETGEVVKEFDVTGWSERRADKLMDGISINLNHDEYYVEQREAAPTDEARR